MSHRAFDWVPRSSLWRALWEYGVDGPLLNLPSDLCIVGMWAWLASLPLSRTRFV